jgi:hypothetical protein
MIYRFVLGLSLMSIAISSSAAESELPIVAEVEWATVRDNGRRLLAIADRNTAILPKKTAHDLKALLQREPEDTTVACEAVQKLLDPLCLLAIQINAESRVKVERGPAVVPLRLKQAAWVLIKVQNDGGVTHALRMNGPEIIRPKESGEGRWLEASLPSPAPMAKELSGSRLEYRLLRLVPREAGRREATFQFDVGQGTQDLGFRAETSILFSIDKQK